MQFMEKMLKSDAIIDIPIGSAFYGRLKECLVFFAQSYTNEQLIEFEKVVNDNLEMADWMKHLSTIMILESAIEEKADKMGLIT
jgi:hypothetical protein